MSSSEIAKKIGINRITLSKYLDILFTQKILSKKKIGSVNFWFLEPGISNIETQENKYIEIQQKLLDSLINGEEKVSNNIILSLVNRNFDLEKIIIDFYVPIINTIRELSNRGKISKTEKIHILSRISDSIRILKYNIYDFKPSTMNVNILIVAGDNESIPVCLLLETLARIKLLNVTFIGNIENYIDPFFDLDFQRYIIKIIHRTNGEAIICIVSNNERSIKFLSSSLKNNEFEKKIKVLIYSDVETIKKINTESSYIYTNIKSFFNDIQDIIKI